MNKNIRKLLLSITLTWSVFLTGCWDRIELQERAFVMVAGIDKYDPEKSDMPEEDKVKKNEESRLKMTYLLPKFSAVKEAEEGKNSRQLLTSVGKTPYMTTRQLTLRQDNQPFFQHMKAVVLGVDLLKNKDYFLELLDGLERQDEISRKLHIFIAEDQASDILKTESLLKPLSYKLQGMSEEKLGTNVFIPITLEEAITSTVKGATLIPKITASKTEIKVGGSAVIKNDRFINWLGEEETKAVAFIRGDVKQDIVEIDFKGVTMPFIIKSLKQKKKTRVEDGKIHIDVKLTIAGDIQQYKVKEYPRLTDMKLIEEIEKEINKKIKTDLEKVIYILQDEMNADVININRYLEA